jgi:hypothetical protein
MDARLLVARIGAVLLLVLGAPEARPHHDEIPDPPPQSTSNRLPALPNLDRTAITVSGLSSGGFFAHQFHIAYSSLVNGAAIMAGGPFACAEIVLNPFSPFWWPTTLDRVSAATVACTHTFGDRYFGLKPAPPRAENSVAFVRDASRRHVIDDPANLADDRVWLFRGSLDKVVPEHTAQALEQAYRSLRVREVQVYREDDKRPANHGLPVARFAGKSKFPVPKCGDHAPPFVIECGFDAAEALLGHLYDITLQPPSDDPHRDGALVAFDQSAFFDGSGPGLARVGYLYVPTRCASGPCRLHVAFHGCRQNVESVHDDFVRDGGYNRWAASNSIVVLYPQAAEASGNPNRCWDFWGYTGAGYYGREAPQMRAVKRMVDALLGTAP